MPVYTFIYLRRIIGSPLKPRDTIAFHGIGKKTSNMGISEHHVEGVIPSKEFKQKLQHAVFERA